MNFHKIIFITITCLTLCSCKSYYEEKRDYEADSFEHVKRKFLKVYDAENPKYSILVFSYYFEGENYKIKNAGNVIFNDTLRTNEMIGHAKYIRIDNRYNTKIFDEKTKKEILVKSKLAIKHKYIYITKMDYLKNSIGTDSILNGRKVKNRKKIYTVTYSNTLLGLM